ncbi:hypothetical protein SRHO_G00034660 [Serrasalmus rhombeus]
MVHLKPVQPSLSQTGAPARLTEQQNTAAHHEEPQEPVRKSSMPKPPDFASQPSAEPQPSTVSEKNQGSNTTSNTH